MPHGLGRRNGSAEGVMPVNLDRIMRHDRSMANAARALLYIASMHAVPESLTHRAPVATSTLAAVTCEGWIHTLSSLPAP